VGKQIVDRANLSRDQFGPIFEVLGVTPDADEHTIANGLAAVLAPTPEGAERRRVLREAVELKNYEFNAHGVEMNHRYRSTAVAEDELPPERWPHDPELFHRPSTRPGAKLPHVWLVDAEGHKVSTLDLVGRGGFTLVTGLSGTAWEATDLPVRVVRIGTAGARDAYGDWGRVSDIAEDGCLLVRPDGYVAWRAESASAGLEALRTAWNRLLSIEVPALV
jgi:2,4-dichlorophenol 6-monooxygenase